MELPRLYGDLAHLWPRLSPVHQYAAEAAMLRTLLDGHGCRSLVEFGAGAGHTLSHLHDHYDCAAVDLSPAMLDQLARLIPGAAAHVGDMRTVRLDRTFDAVLIHDAIDYLTTTQDVRQALATAAAHLAPDGLVLIAPTYTAETFADGETGHDAHGDVAYDAVVQRTGATTFDLRMTCHFDGRSVEDVHACGLFPRSFWLAAMRDAGLDGRHVRVDPWELFTGGLRRGAPGGAA